MTTVPGGRLAAEKVLAVVKAEYPGFTPEPEIRMDFDWFAQGPQAAIVWEEGPDDWAIEVLGAIFAADLGPIWAEPGTGWFLNIYQEIGERQYA